MLRNQNNNGICREMLKIPCLDFLFECKSECGKTLSSSYFLFIKKTIEGHTTRNGEFMACNLYIKKLTFAKDLNMLTI